MKGPAGVGKSAVAQSYAEALHLKKKLGATFFFSRSHSRDDPDRFFTTLASQLAGRHRTYGAHINLEIQHNPDLVKTSLPHQFRGLFVTPLADPQIKGEVGELVIIVDGLDECASKEAQVAIIKIVAESARKETTPFLWIFLSRLEPKIVMTFDLPEVKSVSQQIEVPVSRVIDPQIQRYLVDKLQEIGREHGLPLPWPSEREIKDLVNFSAGLFACAHAITLFASADDPTGPEELLRAVLELAKRLVTRSSDHRLSALDELYKLIMVHVPTSMLQTVQWILLTTCVRRVQYARQSARLSGLSHVQWRKTSGCLHSVMKVGAMDWTGITFYHKSFMDFIEHPTSGPFHIWSDCAITLLEEVLRHLNQIRVDYLGKGMEDLSLSWFLLLTISSGQYLPRLNLASSDSSSEDYVNHIMAFFWVLSSAALNHNARAARALKDFDFRKFCFRPGSEFFISERNIFMQNVGNLDHSLSTRFFCLHRYNLAAYRVETTPSPSPSEVPGLCPVERQKSLLHNWTRRKEGFIEDN